MTNKPVNICNFTNDHICVLVMCRCFCRQKLLNFNTSLLTLIIYCGEVLTSTCGDRTSNFTEFQIVLTELPIPTTNCSFLLVKAPMTVMALNLSSFTFKIFLRFLSTKPLL